MRGFSGVGLAWVTATLVAITIAAAAVGSVRSEITDTPTALGVSASPLPSSDDETLFTPSPVDPPVKKRTDEQAAGPSDLEGIPEAAPFAPPRVPETAPTTEPRGKAVDPDGSPTGTPSSPQVIDSTANEPTPVDESSENPPSQSATSTTTAARTTTTSPPEPEVESYWRLISTEGGSIAVLVIGDTVSFKRGFARDGWRLDVTDSGPTAVQVRYENSDDPNLTISIDARVVSGELVVTISRSQ